jgi:hypothetical protein
MGKRSAYASRDRSERQSGYGEYERRSHGKSKWAGLSVADAFRSNDYWLRMPAQRLFYETAHKIQLAAARLAGVAVNASFRPKIKPQLSPA